MFTGLVEEVASIKKMENISDNAIRLSIEAETIMEDMQIGDSIAVNGICLTVTDIEAHIFSVDVMPETIKSTSLRHLETNNHVNVERALRADSRLGGHFVTGHVDDIAVIMGIKQVENAVYYKLKIPKQYTQLVIDKGSIAVDGISLTIFAVDKTAQDTRVTISIIPHTLQMTILGNKRVGDVVNVEFDMFAKMIQQQLLAFQQES